MGKHDKKQLEINKKGEYVGVVYMYSLKKPGDAKDGWKYIGVTPEEKQRKRMWKNPKNPYAGAKIKAAREKYGIKCFTYTVLEKICDVDLEQLLNKLEQRESYYIKIYDSFHNGFNGNIGGTGRKGQTISSQEIATRKKNPNFHHSAETKQKISQSSKGRTQSPETRAKISRGNKGKKRTLEQRKAESDRLKGKEPIAATEGARIWRLTHDSYWKGKKMPPESIAKMKAAQQRMGTKIVAVEKNGTVREFPTMLDAANNYKISAGSVHYSVNHNSKCRKNGVQFFKKSTYEKNQNSIYGEAV